MSFVYPRLIAIFRQAEPAAGEFGKRPYQEPQTSVATPIWQTAPVFSTIPCSIQEYRAAQRPVDNLPGSETITPSYKIFVPKRVLSRGSVLLHDMILDDVGLRYRVMDTYWNSLGYRLYAELLET